MAELTAPASSPETIGPQEKVKKRGGSSTLARVARYTAVRLGTMAITVTIAVYLTILIANMGGYVDQIRKAEIREQVTTSLANNPANRNLDPQVRQNMINSAIANQEAAQGLNEPFVLRSFGFLTDALTLNLGRAIYMSSNSGSNQVRLIILERLPATLMLFGVADLVLFFLALAFALMLSRSYGSFFDKLSVALTPLSSAPGWFYGIFLILIFASVLKVLPFGRMVDAPPPSNPLDYALSVLNHMILPVAAWSISSIFLSIFTWRTFFLIYSSEDYVDMAKAKGLPARDIQNKYILRPTLPTIITTFALLVINSWLGAPIFETVFNWPGMGQAIFIAIGSVDTPVIVGSTVIFAYLLALTVFLLDIIYALVDPRVKIGGGGPRS
jgi:peptide/nickel transport system permease protein